MKTVNLGDKFTHRITLRLSDEQFNFITNVSNILGVSPSDYLRMVINAGATTMGGTVEKVQNGVSIFESVGGTSNENVKTDSDNFV